jgi:uncharacterized protein (TIGR02246 family)
MSVRTTVAVAALLAAMAPPLHAEQPGKAGAAKPGAQQADEAVARAFKANDANALAAAYAEDAVLYPPGAMEQRGRAAIRQGFADFLAQFRVTDFITNDTHYETSGNVSVGWGRFAILAEPRSGNGQPMRWEGRYTSVARRISGKWLLVQDHASLPMTAAPQVPAPVSSPRR